MGDGKTGSSGHSWFIGHNKQMTTIKITQGLIGTALLKKVRELGADITKEELLQQTGWLQGYTEDGEMIGFTDLYEALMAAGGMELENRAANPEVIHQNVSRLGILGFRWLVYQHDLEAGYDDQLLAKQQDEFFSDLETAVLELKEGLGFESGMVVTDVLGVMAHLLAYIHSLRWDEDNVPTQEQIRENFDAALKWVNDTKLYKRLFEIADEGFTQEEIDDYSSFRWGHHSAIATHLRTVSLDFAAGTRRQDVPSFAEGLKNVKAYLAMLDENSEWTTKGIFYVLTSTIWFEWRTDKPTEEVVEFAGELINRWVAEGRAIRAEHITN